MKIREVTAILGGDATFPYQLECQNFDLLEPQATPVEISRAKCAQAAALVNGPVLVDDTSLHFNALGGMPGPYIKHFYTSMGNSGLAKLLDSFEDRSAYAQCVVSFCPGRGEEIMTFVGIAEGIIIPSSDVAVKGNNNGFGWDPLFIPTGHDVPFGSMRFELKNSLSHRSKALRELRRWVNSRSEE
jgi:inosine triphosphate pyrophosphatase